MNRISNNTAMIRGRNRIHEVVNTDSVLQKLPDEHLVALTMRIAEAIKASSKDPMKVSRKTILCFAWHDAEVRRVLRIDEAVVDRALSRAAAQANQLQLQGAVRRDYFINELQEELDRLVGVRQRIDHDIHRLLAEMDKWKKASEEEKQKANKPSRQKRRSYTSRRGLG